MLSNWHHFREWPCASAVSVRCKTEHHRLSMDESVGAMALFCSPLTRVWLCDVSNHEPLKMPCRIYCSWDRDNLVQKKNHLVRIHAFNTLSLNKLTRYKPLVLSSFIRGGLVLGRLGDCDFLSV